MAERVFEAHRIGRPESLSTGMITFALLRRHARRHVRIMHIEMDRDWEPLSDFGPSIPQSGDSSTSMTAESPIRIIAYMSFSSGFGSRTTSSIKRFFVEFDGFSRTGTDQMMAHRMHSFWIGCISLMILYSFGFYVGGWVMPF